MVKKTIQHFQCEVASGELIPIEKICSITIFENFSCFLKENIDLFIKTNNNRWFEKENDENRAYEETYIENFGYDSYKEYKHIEIYEKLLKDENSFNLFKRNFSYIYTFTKLHHKYLHRRKFSILIIEFINDESKLRHLVPMDKVNNSIYELEEYLNTLLNDYFESTNEKTKSNLKDGFKLHYCRGTL